MPVGQVATVITCVPATSAEMVGAPCPAGQMPQAITAYLLDPSQASYYELLTQGPDYAALSTAFSVPFVFTVSLYLLCRNIGEINRLIRENLGR